jgi:hypothetical protein
MAKVQNALHAIVTQLKTVVEYRSVLPTACDIERCRIANGDAKTNGVLSLTSV